MFSKLITFDNGTNKCVLNSCYTENYENKECAGNGTCFILSIKLNIGGCLCKDENSGEKCIGCQEGYKYSNDTEQCVIDECKGDCGNGQCIYNNNSQKYQCQCQNHYSRESNCKNCIYQFDINTQCMQCIGNYDIKTLCSQCNHGYTVSSNCTQCRRNYDEQKDCNGCYQGYDIMKGCIGCIRDYQMINNICMPQTQKLKNQPLMILGIVLGSIVIVIVCLIIICKCSRRNLEEEYLNKDELEKIYKDLKNNQQKKKNSTS